MEIQTIHDENRSRGFNQKDLNLYFPEKTAFADGWYANRFIAEKILGLEDVVRETEEGRKLKMANVNEYWHQLKFGLVKPNDDQKDMGSEYLNQWTEHAKNVRVRNPDCFDIQHGLYYDGELHTNDFAKAVLILSKLSENDLDETLEKITGFPKEEYQRCVNAYIGASWGYVEYHGPIGLERAQKRLAQ